MLDLVFRNETLSDGQANDNAFNEAFFASILEKAIEVMELAEKSVEVSVNLVDEKRIQELNKKYRNKDQVTDVLSFPLDEEHMSRYNIIALGDIFICLSFAKDKSIREGIALGKNLAWMTVHGFLHLMGYDHPDDSVGTPTLRRRGEEMEALEDKIISKLK